MYAFKTDNKTNRSKMLQQFLSFSYFLQLINYYYSSHSRKLLASKNKDFLKIAKVFSVNFLHDMKFAKLKFAKFRNFGDSQKFLPAKVSAFKVIHRFLLIVIIQQDVKFAVDYVINLIRRRIPGAHLGFLQGRGDFLKLGHNFHFFSNNQ